jgi:hypothetical protein
LERVNVTVKTSSWDKRTKSSYQFRNCEGMISFWKVIVCESRKLLDMEFL